MQNKWIRISGILLVSLFVLCACQSQSPELYTDTIELEDNIAQIEALETETENWSTDEIDHESLNVEYNISATLDEANKIVSSQTNIVYENNTGEALDSIEVIFPMKGLSEEDYKGYDVFDQTVAQEDFSPITFDIGEVIVNGTKGTYEWVGNYSDTMRIQLEKTLKPNEQVSIDFQYDFSLPHSVVLGFEKDRYAFNIWHPVIPFFENGQWQSKHHRNTWYLHVPVAKINLDLTWQSPMQIVSNYNLEEIGENTTSISLKDILDQCLNFYLVKDQKIMTEKKDNTIVAYVFPEDMEVPVDINHINKNLIDLDQKFTSPKMNHLIFFFAENTIIDGGFSMNSYDIKNQSREDIQTGIEGVSISYSASPAFIGSNESAVSALGGISFYRLLHQYAQFRDVYITRFCNQYLDPKINRTNLMLLTEADIFDSTEEQFVTNLKYNSASVLIDLEKEFGEDKIVAMLYDLELEYKYQGMTLDQYIQFIRNYLGELADPIIANYYLIQ